MKNKVTAKLLKGFRDYSGALLHLRSSIIAKAQEVAVLHGFDEVATPHLEYSEVLLGEGGETDKQVFKFLDHGDREVALRYDLTVPFARYAAMSHGTMVLPYKKLQIGNVFRGEKPQKGRYREFMQCDFDVIGSDSWQSEFEVLCSLLKVLHFSVKDTKFKEDVVIELGHREILTAIIYKFLGKTTPEQLTSVFIGLDKLDKIPGSKVVDYIDEHAAIDRTKLTALIDCLESEQVNSFAWLRDNLADQIDVVDSLDSLLKALESERGSIQVKLNLSIARGLAYYTGLVFETFVDSNRKLGSICSGGRYAHLTKRFGVENLSGFGGSLGIDRLLALLEEDHAPAQKDDVFVALAPGVDGAIACDLVSSLRKQKTPTHMSLDRQKLGKQLKLADRLGVRYVLVLGEDEVQNQKYSLKDMRSGKTTEPLGLSEIVEFIRK